MKGIFVVAFALLALASAYPQGYYPNQQQQNQWGQQQNPWGQQQGQWGQQQGPGPQLPSGSGGSGTPDKPSGGSGEQGGDETNVAVGIDSTVGTAIAAINGNVYYKIVFAGASEGNGGNGGNRTVTGVQN